VGKFRHRLLRLLALVLLVQSALGLAHALPFAAGMAAAGMAVELCTREGKRLVFLDAEGQPIPSDPAANVFCPACHGLPVVVLPRPSNVPVMLRFVAVPGFALLGGAMAPVRARPPPYVTRAPPGRA
jgi:hypothetical protein